MKIEDIDLCASYWTVSGAVYPGAPSEVSPFPLKDRAEVAGRVGWRGMGFVIDDMEASIARYDLPTVRRIFSDNGIRHVELEFLVDWHLDGAKRRASEAMYDRMLEISAELGIEKGSGAAYSRRASPTCPPCAAPWPRSASVPHPGDRCRHRVPTLRQHQRHRSRAGALRRARDDEQRAACRHLARRARRHDRRRHPQDPARAAAGRRA